MTVICCQTPFKGKKKFSLNPSWPGMIFYYIVIQMCANIRLGIIDALCSDPLNTHKTKTKITNGIKMKLQNHKIQMNSINAMGWGMLFCWHRIAHNMDVASYGAGSLELFAPTTQGALW